MSVCELPGRGLGRKGHFCSGSPDGCCPPAAAVTVKVKPATDYCTQRHCLAGLCSLIATDPVTMR